MASWSPAVAPHVVPVSALANAVAIFVSQAACLTGSGGISFARPFASTPSRHFAFFPAAFSFADWHLLGGLTAIDAFRSFTWESTVASICPSETGDGQAPAASAFANAVENFASHPESLAGSGRVAFAAAFARTPSLHEVFLPAALASPAAHLPARAMPVVPRRNASPAITAPAALGARAILGPLC